MSPFIIGPVKHKGVLRASVDDGFSSGSFAHTSSRRDYLKPHKMKSVLNILLHLPFFVNTVIIMSDFSHYLPCKIKEDG